MEGRAWRHFDLFGGVYFHFHDVRACNVSQQKAYEVQVNSYMSFFPGIYV